MRNVNTAAARDTQYSHGRIGPISNEEMTAKAKEFLPELFRSFRP